MDAALAPRFTQAPSPNPPGSGHPASGPPPLPGQLGRPPAYRPVIGPYTDPSTTQADRQYAMLTHLASMSSLLSLGIPAPGLAAVLIMWLMGRKRSPFIDDHGRQAINFQLSVFAIYTALMVAGILFAILTLGVGAAVFELAPAVMFGMSVALVIGAVRGMIAATRGTYYRYPMCFQFLG